MKKGLHVFLALSMILTSWTVCIPASAITVEDLVGEYLYYYDFSEGSSLEGWSDYEASSKKEIALSDIMAGTATTTSPVSYSVTPEGTLKMTRTSSGYTYLRLPNIPYAAEQGQLVVSFRFKLSSTASNYLLGSRNSAYGSDMFKAFTGKIYTSFNETTGNVDTYRVDEWKTITCVYDNDSTKRDLYIDGEYITTADKHANDTGNFLYSSTGFKFCFAFSAPADATAEVDDIMIYTLPEELNYEVVSAAGNQVVLNFNLTPDAIAPSDMEVMDEEGNPVAISNVSANPADARSVIVTFADKLTPGGDYTIKANNVTVGAETAAIINDMTASAEPIAFSVKPDKVYADNISIGTDALANGDYTVTADFYNASSDDVTPMLVAGLYNADNKLIKLQTKSFDVSALTTDGTPLTMDIEVENAANSTLKVFAVKDAEDLVPVSSVYTWDKNGANTPEVYDAEKAVYKKALSHTDKIDGDTQKITTTVAQAEELAGREAMVVVLKEGKTIADIDYTEPLETVVAFDFFTVSEAGATYAIEDVTGDYESYVYVSNVNNHSEGEFKYFDKEYVDAGLLIIKDIEENEVAGFLADYEQALSIDLSDYNALTENDVVKEKTLVAKSIVAQRKETETQEFANFEEFFDALSAAIELAQIRTVDDVEAKIAGMEETVITSLLSDTLSQNAVDAVYAAVFADKPLTIQKFEDAVEKHVILRGIQYASNYSQTTKIMEDTADITNVDLTDYNKVNGKKAVNLKVTGNSYESIEALVEAFENAADAQREKESSSVGSSNNGVSVSSPVGSIQIDKNATAKPTVTPTPVAPEKEENFTDLTGFEWAKDAIYTLVEKGIVNGKSETAYAPQDKITRAEFAKLAVAAFGLTGSDAQNPFADVNDNDWFCDVVKTAFTNKLINGTSEATFSPNVTITREDAVLILYRALVNGGKQFTETKAFADDAAIADYAKDAVAALGGAGIVNGDDTGAFNAKAELTRAEAAVIIYNIVK